MKKFIIMGVLLFFGIAGCKKGENDPFFSLRTRKARVVNDWKLSFREHETQMSYVENGVSILEYTYSMYNDNTITNKYYKTFDGVEQTQSTINTSSNNDNVYIWAFHKNGSLEISNNQSGNIEKSIWLFLTKNENAKIKRKEFIRIESNPYITDNILTNSITYSGFNNINSQVKIFQIDRLSNKEMVLIYNSSETIEGNKVNITGKIILKK